MLRAEELKVQATAVLAQLAESGGTPESHIYIHRGMNLRDSESVRDVLKDCGFVRVSRKFVEESNVNYMVVTNVTRGGN
jgi:hypothetical protein